MSLSYHSLKQQVSEQLTHILEDSLSGRDATQLQTTETLISQRAEEALHQASPNFKYMVLCVLMEKKDAALTAHSSCQWDPDTDANFSVTWSSPALCAVLSVFAVAI
jgi:dynein light chain Tctex-type 1